MKFKKMIQRFGFVFFIILYFSSKIDNMNWPLFHISDIKEVAIDITKDQTQKQLTKVHFIDVGQGDSILIESDGHYMLVDAGENNQGDTVVKYLNDVGVKKLDYVVGTHPHSDHIGGLDDVIDEFTTEKVILPDVIHNTATFEDVLDAIADKNLKITKAEVGNSYDLGTTSFTILAPNSTDYDNLNCYSVVIKIVNGNNSFLLTGDAETISEREMLKKKLDVSADVLKLGHHGSSYSSTLSFINKVSPEYAVISVGAENKYGHPHEETLLRMSERGIKIYQTDEQGTIIFTSDGTNITVDKKDK